MGRLEAAVEQAQRDPLKAWYAKELVMMEVNTVQSSIDTLQRRKRDLLALAEKVNKLMAKPTPPYVVDMLDADKRGIDIWLKVDGLEYCIKHKHWIDPPETKVFAVEHDGSCEVLRSEYWKYHFKGEFQLGNRHIEIHRTYDDGCFISVDHGPKELITVGIIDGQDFGAKK